MWRERTRRDYEFMMTAAVTAKLSPTAMSQGMRGKIAPSSAPDPFATPVQTRLSPRKILGWNERERDVEAETSVEDVHCESKWDYLSAGRFSSEPRVRPKRSVTTNLPTYIARQETPHLLKLTYDSRGHAHTHTHSDTGTDVWYLQEELHSTRVSLAAALRDVKALHSELELERTERERERQEVDAIWDLAQQREASLLWELSLIHISEPTRRRGISYAVFCLKKKK